MSEEQKTYTVSRQVSWQKCIVCGREVFTLSLPEETFCGNGKCEQRKCSRCGYSGIALDEHHIHGRKISDETIILCSNCHRELHEAAE